MHSIRWGTWLLVGLALAGCRKDKAREAPREAGLTAEVLAKIKGSTVMVKAQGKSGSGFVARVEAGAHYLVTNRHVVADGDRLPDKVTVVYASGLPSEWSTEASVVASDNVNDLAVLHVPRPLVPASPLPAMSEVRETSFVTVAGFPFGQALAFDGQSPAATLSRGSISSLRKGPLGNLELLQLDLNLNPGNSGGPVIDEQGRLVGVAVATIKGAGIGFVVPWEHVTELLDGHAAAYRLDLAEDCTDACQATLEVDVADPFKRTQQLEVRLIEADATFTNLTRTVPYAAEGTVISSHDRPASGRFVIKTQLALSARHPQYLQLAYKNGAQTTFGLPVALRRPEPAEVRAPPPSRAAVPDLPSGIEVMSATYGANCGAPVGNVTSSLRAACSRRGSCEYRIDVGSLGDPSPGCAKSFVVSWQCSGGPTLSASVPPEANGHRVRLGCGVDAAPPPAPAAPKIAVVRASYGTNCGAPAGNATAPVAEACDGRRECEYEINANRIGDPAFGCQKTFEVIFGCDGADLTTVRVPKEAHGRSALLSCRPR